MNRIVACALGFTVSCAPVPQDAPPSHAVALTSVLPPMRVFEKPVVTPARRSNTEIAQDFLDLLFRMESGRAVPQLTRFEGPITVHATGQTNLTMMRDLDALIGRLRSEANLNIMRVAADEPTAITVQAVPRATMQSAVLRAACFVVPRLTSWDEFKIARRTPQVDWTTLTRCDRAAISVPSDVGPQENRDCLHEELAQALGPLNDLYRLPNSVFNDDNIHTVLTGFDMLVLGTFYAPEIQNSMTRGEVAIRLPQILARLNPVGQQTYGRPQNDTSRDWIEAMETALANGASPLRRRQAALRAISLGQAFGWTGPRAGFAQYAYGRLQVGNDASTALTAFNTARKAYGQDSSMRIHAAHIAVQQAAFSLASGDAETTIKLVDAGMDVAERHQNAALLATLMMFKATALDMRGDTAQAESLRLDSLGWARYGFGYDQNVQARLDKIAALRPF